ncbi:TetR/AcrR family transcriptional regulator [Sphingobium sp. BHU LFT2]|uniref:TetR/AcrR family transcriptional regulator n=1 Tax=Sphingobium sp. BHU LFT2 TaxID=2807634 RepID=UPI0020357A02|nr:TetR/AcrR family transcriptional regulator [Sphingobium sp. BHU LFT2]
MLVVEGHKHMAEVGFARFSAREVAKRIGYSVGTIYNVFGDYDHLIIAINTRTFRLWAQFMREALEKGGTDRIATLVECYFAFARSNRKAWTAIYDHHLPSDMEMPQEHDWLRSELTEIVVTEVRNALPEQARTGAGSLARSLIAIVHGHCAFDLSGSFRLMGEAAPVDMALARVREVLAAAADKAADAPN